MRRKPKGPPAGKGKLSVTESRGRKGTRCFARPIVFYVAVTALVGAISAYYLCWSHGGGAGSSSSPDDAVHPEKGQKNQERLKTTSASQSNSNDKRSSRSNSKQTSSITPDWVADQIDILVPNLDKDKLRQVITERQEFGDREAYIRRGKKFGVQGQWHNATALFRHILEHDPFDEEVKKLLFNSYERMYPFGPSGKLSINLTQSYLDTTGRHAKQGWMIVHGRNVSIRRLHKSIPAYVMENFLSEDECRSLQGEHHRIQTDYNVYPLVCFQHNAFLNHRRLKKHFIPNTFCLGQTVSAALAPLLKWSTSSGCHRGESRLAAMVEDRINLAVGLPEDHGYNLQLLSYPANVSYNDHTDCLPGRCGITSDRDAVSDRVGTFLVYLNEVEGGELAFPKLNVKVSPKCGRAVAFYSYDNDCCNLLTTHSSEMVSANESRRKMAVQKWYTYRSAPYQSERKQRPGVKELLPYQPIVSCDYILDGGETSCRWYDFWPFSVKG